MTNLRTIYYRTIVATALQVFVLLVISFLEFVGLLRLEKMLLDGLWYFYWPGICLYKLITPGSWHTLGNVMDSFFAMAFAALVYSVLAVLAFGVLIGRRPRTS